MPHADAAWKAAQEFGCRDELWLDLARRREIFDPEGATGVYRREIARLIGLGRATAYPDAMELVGRMCALLVEGGRREDADDYLTELRLEFGRKRSFIKLLDSLPVPGRRSSR